jgi:chemotaxis protein methyltransferase CheR
VSGQGEAPELAETDFRRLRDLLHALAGIDLGPDKRSLVAHRLHRRLRALALPSYQRYADLVLDPAQTGERQTAVDLLTTNETYFFREPPHFAFLKQSVAANHQPGRAWRIWSAACATGEEPYSLAMTMADTLGDQGWDVLGSDISRRVLEQAQRAHYPMVRLDHFCSTHLRRYCLKGTGPQEGTLLIGAPLRQRVAFQAINLMAPLPDLGLFDFVFLRNALIYFNRADRQTILRGVQATLRPGGHLVVSHSESLQGMVHDLEAVQPSIYRRPS